MGSHGEEEQLVQMVRDFIEIGSITPTNIHDMSSTPQLLHNPQLTLQDVLAEVTDDETEVLEKVLMYVRNMGEPNSLKKWVVMRLQMDGYEASLCRTSWASTFGPKVFQFVGDYEYIDVMMMMGDKNMNSGSSSSSGKQPTRLIVDMDFKTQFEVARPTQTYKELVASLPSVFVGTEERLNKVISLLCSAAKKSLKEKGLHIPPWRKTHYMQSKWFSNNCKKVSAMPNTELGNSDETGEGVTTTTCCPSIF